LRENRECCINSYDSSAPLHFKGPDTYLRQDKYVISPSLLRALPGTFLIFWVESSLTGDPSMPIYSQGVWSASLCSPSLPQELAPNSNVAYGALSLNRELANAQSGMLIIDCQFSIDASVMSSQFMTDHRTWLVLRKASKTVFASVGRRQRL
jgi:hypothetical protein